MTDLLRSSDLIELARAGISAAEARRQLTLLATPPPPIRLLRPATLGDGILRLDAAASHRLQEALQRVLSAHGPIRFVPASGAATRMFSDLLAALDAAPNGAALASTAPASTAQAEPLGRLRRELAHLPFDAEVSATLDALGMSRRELEGCDDAAFVRFARALLLGACTSSGLSALPKALLPFHHAAAPETSRAALTEHLREAVAVRGGHTPTRVHFTVSPEHLAEARALALMAARQLESETGGSVVVELSVQDPATDTLALDAVGQPLRADDGSLVRRPGGHGALLGNLSALARLGHEQRSMGDAPSNSTPVPWVTIKNIDNVMPAAAPGSAQAVAAQQLLLGHLESVRGRLHQALAALERSPRDPAPLDAVLRIAAEDFGLDLDALRGNGSHAAATVIRRLDRPIRVCGVVEHRGEPGGGPFWVETAEGPTLQIVETSQIDRSDPEQTARLGRQSHFNPVDVACYLYDHRGSPHQLERFVDPLTSFIATKSHQGRAIRALERPGLWNGAMAGWLTVFVEIPASAFAPVKTVWDLLRPEHRPV